jgi:general L-amino acid transport system permease protein
VIAAGSLAFKGRAGRIVVLGLAALAVGALGLGLNGAGLRFDFLWQLSGFQIAESPFAVGAGDPVWLSLLAGLANTLRVSLAAIVLAVPLGITLALLRGSSLRPLAWVATAIIEAVRNTPVLLQLFLSYGIFTALLPGPSHAVHVLPGVLLCNRGLFLPWWGAGGIEFPTLSGFNIEGGVSVSPELAVLGFGLALFHGCYLAEIFRAGFRAIPQGQRDAALALSLPRWLTLRKIVLPQALRFALPAITMQILALVKNSSLAVAIGYPDFIAVLNTTIYRNGRALEGLILTIIVYLGLNAALGAAISRAGQWFCGPAPGELVGQPYASAAPRSASRTEWLIAAALVLAFAWPTLALVRWGVIDAVWRGTPADCVAAGGACWAVVSTKMPLLLFGPYPRAELWRPEVATLLVVALIIGCGRDRLRHPGACMAALLTTVATWIWLCGGGAGLSRVISNDWGGLTLTIDLAAAVLALASLLAYPLTIARRAENPALAVPARLFIEIFRSVPLVALLLSADLLIPTLLPSGWQMDKLWRAYAAITGLTMVSLAEVLRGALDSVAAGQTDAARALGLSARQVFRLVVLPQAIRIATPATVNVFVGAIKDTSLVLIIGILDVTGAAKAALADPEWRAFAPEMYLFLALLYGALCFPLARFGRRLEGQTSRASAFNRRSISAASL